MWIGIIPSAKFLMTFNSVENDLSTLAQDKYYVLENNSLPNDMPQRFSKQKVNSFFHDFLDELNPNVDKRENDIVEGEGNCKEGERT